MQSSHANWHHAPLHVFVPNTVYMVTGATLYRAHLLSGHQRLNRLQAILIEVTQQYHWELRAWAVFSNHYHFIARAPERPASLSRMIQHLHSDASKHVNRLDNKPGRKVWYQYWDKCLTFEKSYYARLNYVNNNPVHHRLVPVASQYPYCTAREFQNRYPSSFCRKVASFKCDRINEPDDYEPICDVGEET